MNLENTPVKEVIRKDHILFDSMHVKCPKWQIWGAEGWEGERNGGRGTGNVCGVSLRGNKNVLKLTVVVDPQLCKHKTTELYTH